MKSIIEGGAPDCAGAGRREEGANWTPIAYEDLGYRIQKCYTEQLQLTFCTVFSIVALKGTLMKTEM